MQLTFFFKKSEKVDIVAPKKKLFLVILLKRHRRRRRRLKATSKTKRQKKYWMRNIFQKRDELGDYHHLVQGRKLGDREYYFRLVYIFSKYICFNFRR